jgi:phosphoribosylglycinamide formyltransferase 1
MIRVAIFASGSGSNAQRIIEHFMEHEVIRVELVVSNNPDAFVLERAKNLKVEFIVFDRKAFYESDIVCDTLKEKDIHFLVLAGFLWLIPGNLLKAYPNRIINIHPALLPKFGGKGMYGLRVHEAVIEAREKESGITIHYVNEKYDDGQIIFQAKCAVEPGETPESLAMKIHQLEYKYFPEVVEQVILKNF